MSNDRTTALHDIVRHGARDYQSSLDGTMMTPPALLATDGTSLTWAADVRINGFDNVMRNVPIAIGNRELIYAASGSAVTVARNPGGRFEIIGFSKRKPGRRILVPVDLDTLTYGDAIDMTLTSRLLTLDELSSLGLGFGTTPFGATGFFRAGSLVEIRT